MRNRITPTLICINSGVLLLVTFAGCLDRDETIRVKRDGSAEIKLAFKGSEEELAGPQAMPTEADGWRIIRSTRKEGEDVKHILEAEKSIKADEPLPATYGARDSVFINFPTELRREIRDDGVYYHFHRRYQPRSFARTQFWQDQFMDDEKKALMEKENEVLTIEERRKLFQTLAKIESMKRLETLESAAQSGIPGMTDTAQLKARSAMLAVFESFDYEAFAASIEKAVDQAEANAMIERVGESLPADAEKAYVETLQSVGNLDVNAMTAFHGALEREKLRQKITEATRNHSFHVRVELPGEIIAHDGDRIDEEGMIVWEFNGAAFCDRTYDLRAVSRVAAAQN